MKSTYSFLTMILLVMLHLSSCSEQQSAPAEIDIVADLFPEAQEELREAVATIVKMGATSKNQTRSKELKEYEMVLAKLAPVNTTLWDWKYS